MSRAVVLRNGRVVTMAAEAAAPASAIAVAGDRIAAVGGDRAVAQWCTGGARVIDLDGRAVIPGLIDAHAHMEREGLKQVRVDLGGCRSIADVLDRVRRAAAARAPGEWVVTMPVGTAPYYLDGPDALAERRMPDRHELDGAAPRNPVYIMGPFGTWSRVPTHAALNTPALELAGILDGRRARCGGVDILTGDDGLPSGVVVEHNERPTLELDLLRCAPRFDWAERLAAVRRSMGIYNAAGTTSVYEGHGSYAESVALYQRLWERGELTVRVSLTISPTWSEVDEARRVMRDWLGFARGHGIGDQWLRVSGVFIGFGGNACVAELVREALPDTGWTGFVEWHNDLARYEALVTLAAEHDLRVHTVILEDLPTVLPALERVAARFPIRERRWVMEHVGRLSPADHARVKALGLAVTTIPVYQLWKNGDDYFDAPDSGNGVVTHRSLLEAGVPVAIGTDNVPVSLFKAMAVCRERRERASGRVIGPRQRVGGREALALCTANAAWLSFEERCKGTLEPGRLADLVVLPEDPTATDPERLEAMNVEATMVGGRFVHEAWH